MTTTTYSFSDIRAVIQFPGLPAYTINGQGANEMSVSYANDNSSHDVAADGSVMVSKIKADNGQIALTLQQTSPLHHWLKNAFNFLRAADASVWAAGSIDIQSQLNTYDTGYFAGVSFLKRADQPFQAQGQNVTWTFMFAEGAPLGSSVPAISTNVAANII